MYTRRRCGSRQSCYTWGKCMRTTKTLKPGQKGTKELMSRFGPSLLCVRYRYDEVHREHVKTVELVVHRSSREREAECPGSQAPGTGNAGAGSADIRSVDSRSAGSRSAGIQRARAGDVAPRRVALRIGRRERELQQRVKSAGGRWDPVRQVWMLRQDVVERLDLLPRVVGG